MLDVGSFNLARKQGRLTRIPYIAKLTEDTGRQEFFEKGQSRALCEKLPEHLADDARLLKWAHSPSTSDPFAAQLLETPGGSASRQERLPGIRPPATFGEETNMRDRENP
jgi:hypothetical protein